MLCDATRQQWPDLAPPGGAAQARPPAPFRRRLMEADASRAAPVRPRAAARIVNERCVAAPARLDWRRWLRGAQLQTDRRAPASKSSAPRRDAALARPRRLVANTSAISLQPRPIAAVFVAP